MSGSVVVRLCVYIVAFIIELTKRRVKASGFHKIFNHFTHRRKFQMVNNNKYMGCIASALFSTVWCYRPFARFISCSSFSFCIYRLASRSLSMRTITHTHTHKKPTRHKNEFTIYRCSYRFHQLTGSVWQSHFFSKLIIWFLLFLCR